MVFTIQYIHAYLQAHKHTYENKIIQVLQFEKRRNVTCGYKRCNRIIKHFHIAMLLAKDLK